MPSWEHIRDSTQGLLSTNLSRALLELTLLAGGNWLVLYLRVQGLHHIKLLDFARFCLYPQLPLKLYKDRSNVSGLTLCLVPGSPLLDCAAPQTCHRACPPAWTPGLRSWRLGQN